MPAPALSLPQHPLSNTPFARALPDSLISSWWRLLDVRRDTAGPAAGGERRAFERLTQRLDRSASKGQTIHLGSTEQPYAPCFLGGVSAAAVLRAHEGLNVKIVAISAQFLDELALWRSLDQHHAVVVEVPITLGRSTVLNGQQRERLFLARRIAEMGIETRLQVCCDDKMSSSQLRDLFDEAFTCGVSDISLSKDESRLPKETGRLFRQLRLQFDFPRDLGWRAPR